MIGMTLVPEAVLAWEREICYASVSTVTDYDCWREEDVSAEMVQEVARKNLQKTKEILELVIPNIPEKRNCGCKDALEGAFI